MTRELFDKHEKTLSKAVETIRSRAYWTAYPEVPSGKIYGETAKADGLAAFQARLGKPFEIDQPGTPGGVGGETSPYGIDIGATYPKATPAELVAASKEALSSWKKTTPQERVGVCLEILDRLNKRSFELANAVMHTTGQGFMMAFQAGGPHAQDRALEAVAYAHTEMSHTPERATWEKQVSKTDTVKLEKRFRVVPRGVAVVIGCSTFPTWNGYPAIFADLATGNPVIVKPHPGATLPLAITVEVCREVLGEFGYDKNIVMLAADDADEPIAKELVTHEGVKIVDYTGSSAFGSWIEQNATQAEVYTEKAGVNSIVMDSANDLKAVTGNLAFSLSLYSGQMCTTPQNIFIPEGGIDVGGTKTSFDEVAKGIVGAVNWFLGDDARAAEVLGAIQNENTARRVDEAAAEGGTVLREPTAPKNEAFPDARMRSPLILKVSASDRKLFEREMFGPIVYLIATKNTDESIRLAADIAEKNGAITAAVYSTSEDVLDRAEHALTEAGAAVSSNLTGHIYMNQAAAFSDFHVSGANPSGNATLCDAAFVSGRFRTVYARRMVS